MKKKISVTILLAVWGLLTLGAWFGPSADISETERRKLAQLPKFSMESLASGAFAQDFERYTLDQFPLRDRFRQGKALFHYYVLGQKDNNGIYLKNGYAAKQQPTLDQASLDHAMSRFQWVYDSFLGGCRVYFAVVPDKNYYLAQAAGQPSMDYGALFDGVRQAAPWATYIDLTGSLSLEDYYRTDTHWRQEALLPVAQTIATTMGNDLPQWEGYRVKPLERPFYGVYYGQAALPMAPETISLLESAALDACQVYDFETGKTGKIYDETKLTSRDLYDVYLSGARALLTIENPAGQPGKELLVFRDSFGSSLVPLLVGDYSKVTLIDLRYIAPRLLDSYLEFESQDVLFLYSTLVLNESDSLK